ncbi:MAG: CCA tRNA nucleotidyltransferase [Eubacteriales bacterium]|nr:CCA tRNA nucleotidyltransferase [Eubacteriales bacterium]
MENRWENIVLPPEVTEILSGLHGAGYEACIVGGCVRDIYMGKEPVDWDLTTSAKPDEIKRIFRRTVDTGIAHGTVTVLIENRAFEVTTYRVDGEYKDGRHPESVHFTTDLEEDLLRRDFTMNAMAYDPKRGIIDPYDGRADIERQCIRCVGHPMNRFREDALRILRAIRFSAQFGFGIEPETFEAMKALAENLRHVSMERIRTELYKALAGKVPERLAVLSEIGALPALFPPDIVKVFETGAMHRSLFQAAGLEAVISRLALFLYTAKVSVRPFLRALRFDKKTIYMVEDRVNALAAGVPDTAYAIRKQLSLYGPDAVRDATDILAATGRCTLPEAARLQATYRAEEVNPYRIRELAVDGEHLLAMGYRGRILGEILAACLEAVLRDPSLNELHKLEEIIRKNYIIT